MESKVKVKSVSQNEFTTREFFDRLTRSNPDCKIVGAILYLMLNNPELKDIASKELKQWVKDCTAPEAYRELVRGGHKQEAHTFLLLCGKDIRPDDIQEPDSDENRIVDFYSRLTDREKLLIAAYDVIASQSGWGSDNGKLDQKLSNAVEFDADNIPADLQWLVGAMELAKTLD